MSHLASSPIVSSSRGQPDAEAPFAELLSVSSACDNVPLSSSDTVLGRLHTCDVQIENAYISGQHCKFRRMGLDSVLLQDLSTNGSFVNGKRVGKGKYVDIMNGDQISLTLPPRQAVESNIDHIAFIYRDLTIAPTSCMIAETDNSSIRMAYDVVKVLGAGSFGQVFLAVEKESRRHCALKCVDKSRFEKLGQDEKEKSSESLQSVLEEVHVLNRLHHPNIIRIFDVKESPQYLVISLAVASGGDLEELLKSRGKIGETDARSLIVQVLNALKYLHSQNVIHRDLKPANVLLHLPVDGSRMPRLMVTDFGLSKVVDKQGSRCKTICGTPYYVAPEIAEGSLDTRLKESGYDERVDLWSAGIILYEMVCGSLPFVDVSRIPLPEQILNMAQPGHNVKPTSRVTFSQPLQVFLNQLLTGRQDRLDAAQALHHPWMLSSAKLRHPNSGKKRKESSLSRDTTVRVNPLKISPLVSAKRVKRTDGSQG